MKKIRFAHFNRMQSRGWSCIGISTFLRYLQLMVIGFLSAVTMPAQALNFTIIESTSANAGHDMDTEWFQLLNSLGHVPVILPQTTLDNNTFFATTDVLIISSGVISLPPNRVTTILQFLQTGKPVYLQSEYLASYSSNQAFASLVSSLGGFFTWSTAFTGDLQPMNVLGTYATTNNIVPSIGYFWYSVSGYGDCNVFNVLEYGGGYHGFQYVPSNPLWGSIITTADQDWVRATTSPALMANIITHLITPPLPVSTFSVNLGNDTTLCQGTSLILDATIPNATYLWQNNSTAPVITVTQPGTYWVQVSQNGCTATDTITVSFTPPPVVALGNDTTLCSGGSVSLNVFTPGATYLWQDSTTSPLYQVTQSGVYWVAVNSGGCVAIDSITITFTPVPVVSLGNDTLLCDGDLLLLDASVINGTYQWHDGSGGPGFTVTQSGTYWVTVTVNNCSAADTIVVNFNPVPAVSLGNDTTLCQGESLLLDVSMAGGSYLWHDNTTTPQYTITQPGMYYVQVTVGNCSSTDTLIVDYTQLPQVSLGNDVTLCQGETYTLDATTPNATYLWNNNSTSPVLVVSQAGMYWVQVTVNNCNASDTIMVNYNSLPVVSLGNDTLLCDGDQLLLDATQNNATYLWSDNSSLGSVTVTQSGSYWVQVTVNNCTSSDTIQVLFNPLPVVDLGADVTLCTGESLTLDVTQANATYQWNTGSSQSSILVTQPGNYWVMVTSANCSSSDTVAVNFNQVPLVFLGNDTLLCDDDNLVLNAGNEGAAFLWQDGSTGQEYVVTAPGIYFVEVTLAGCMSSDSIAISAENCLVVIEMPNVFTPNGDGYNDTFHPLLYEGITTATLIVFDRWGKLLFEDKNITTGWNGKFNGADCTDGTYFWMVNYTDRNNHSDTLKGTLTLIR